MRKVLTYIGLHFRLQFRSEQKSDVKSKIATIFMTVATCAVVLLLSKYLFDIISRQILTEVSPEQFSVLIFLIAEIALVIVGVVLEIKFFLKPQDIQVSARFPMSSFSLFVSQLIIVYIYLLGFAFLGLMPIMSIYVWSAGILSAAFFGQLLLAVLFAPLIPFAFATILVVPTMFIMVALKNQNTVKLIIFLLFLIGAFVLYNYVLNFLAEYYVHQKVNSATRNSVVSFVAMLNNGWNFFSYVNNLAFGTEILKSIGIILSISVVVLGIGIGISIPVYAKVRESVLEGKKGIFKKRTKINSNNAFVAIFKKEFKEILRTHTYAYFYLGVALTTPVMVLLTNRLIQKVGEAQIGGNIAFGISILVVLAFMCMINSFSATAISREGKHFYITKIVPVDYRTQLLSKALLNALISVGALLVSVIILCSMNFISVLQAFVVFVVALLVALGVIFNGFNLNLRFPALKSGGEGNQTNITITMFIGFVISALEGVVAIVLSFIVELQFIYLILVAVAMIYALVNALVFAFTANKKYAGIE